MEFVDSQPATLSTHRILKKYRSQGGHIDHNFAFPYVTHVTEKKTRLDYFIKYPTPRLNINGVKVFNKILSKKEIAYRSRDLVKYADKTDAESIHLKWTRIKINTVTFKSYALEEPIIIDEVF